MTLEAWKLFLSNAVEQVRLTPMSDNDRDALIDHLKTEAEMIAFGPLLAPTPKPMPHRDDPWSDLGYESRERDHEDRCQF